MNESRRPDYLKLVTPPKQEDHGDPRPNYSLDDIFGMDEYTVNDIYKRFSIVEGAEMLLLELSREENNGRITKAEKGLLFVVVMTAKVLGNENLKEGVVALLSRGQKIAGDVKSKLTDKARNFLEEIEKKLVNNQPDLTGEDD